MKDLNKQRVVFIDYIKAILIILVIINHSHVFEESNPLYLFIIRMAVPAFMLLSGFTFSMTSERKSFAEMYRISDLLKRFLRFTIPISITYIVCVILEILKNGKNALNNLILDFLLGNYGMGAYYYCIMIEFILIAPILLLILKK